MQVGIRVEERGAWCLGSAATYWFVSGHITIHLRKWQLSVTGREIALIMQLIQQMVVNVCYCFFPFAAALSIFSCTLNVTILLIKLKGMGLSTGNRTEPFAPSYTDNSSLNCSIPLGVG